MTDSDTPPATRGHNSTPRYNALSPADQQLVFSSLELFMRLPGGPRYTAADSFWAAAEMLSEESNLAALRRVVAVIQGVRSQSPRGR